jgi:hypothetical protein
MSTITQLKTGLAASLTDLKTFASEAAEEIGRECIPSNGLGSLFPFLQQVNMYKTQLSYTKIPMKPTLSIVLNPLPSTDIPHPLRTHTVPSWLVGV